MHSFFPRHSSGGVHSTSLNFERSGHWTHNFVRSSILHPVYTTDIHTVLRNSIFRTLWTSVVCLLTPPAVEAEAQRFLTARPLAGGRSLSQDTPRHSEKHFKTLRFCRILSDSVSIAAASLQPTARLSTGFGKQPQWDTVGHSGTETRYARGAVATTVTTCLRCKL